MFSIWCRSSVASLWIGWREAVDGSVKPIPHHNQRQTPPQSQLLVCLQQALQCAMRMSFRIQRRSLHLRPLHFIRIGALRLRPRLPPRTRRPRSRSGSREEATGRWRELWSRPRLQGVRRLAAPAQRPKQAPTRPRDPPSRWAGSQRTVENDNFVR